VLVLITASERFPRIMRAAGLVIDAGMFMTHTLDGDDWKR
jgi:hypothetical protein